MQTKIIFYILKVSVSVMYYFLIAVSLVFVISTIANLLNTEQRFPKMFTSNVYTGEVLVASAASPAKAEKLSADGAVAYRPITDRLFVKVNPTSSFGYYLLIMKSLLLAIGIAILWNFKQIFITADIEQPFRQKVMQRLKILVILYISADLIKIFDYFMYNRFIRHSLTDGNLQLIATIGSDLITGLIIWILAVIYQRALNLQEENALTV